jgi:hypothetical protein
MTSTQSVHAGRRYRRLTIGAVIAGVIGLFVGVEVGQPLAGLVLYAVAVVVTYGITGYVWYSDSLAMTDEREAKLERRASHVTAVLLGGAGVFTITALSLLQATGQYTIGPLVDGAMGAFVVFWATWGVIYLWFRYRP